MDKNPYAPQFADLPEIIPIFPLAGVLLLPYGNLPLNIFETRYIQMFDDAMGGNRIIGMIQPQTNDNLYEIGCAGKIIEFSETSDGRYIVKLSGISRFRVQTEMNTNTSYRQVNPCWKNYKNDLDAVGCLNLDRDKLMDLLGIYFSNEELVCDWNKIKEASDGYLITCLSMICPFEPKEKQALLEAPCCKSRAITFMSMLEMAVHKMTCSSQH